MFLSYFVLTHLSAIGYNSTQPLGILLRKVFYHEQEPLPAGRSRPPRLRCRHLRNRRRPWSCRLLRHQRRGRQGFRRRLLQELRGYRASTRSTPRHSTSSSTTAPRPMTTPSPPAPGPRPSRTPASLRSERSDLHALLPPQREGRSDPRLRRRYRTAPVQLHSGREQGRDHPGDLGHA